MAEVMSTHLQHLRQSFDAVFSEPWLLKVKEVERFLFFRLGNDPYAVALSEIVSVLTDRKISAVNTTHKAFLGIIGLRGEVISVYHLPLLLNYSKNTSAGRYFLLCGGEHVKIALNISVFEGYKLIAREDIFPAEHEQIHIKNVLKTEDEVRQVLLLSALIKELGI